MARKSYGKRGGAKAMPAGKMGRGVAGKQRARKVAAPKAGARQGGFNSMRSGGTTGGVPKGLARRRGH
jgi:hypothetical protein